MESHLFVDAPISNHDGIPRDHACLTSITTDRLVVESMRCPPMLQHQQAPKHNVT